MSDDELLPMDAQMAALLAVKKVAPEPTAEARARVLAGVMGRIGALPPGGQGGGGGSGGGARRFVTAHPLAAVVSALAVGIGVGGAAFAPRVVPERIVYVDRAVPSVSVAAMPAFVPVPAAQLAPTPPTPEAVVQARASKPDSSLDSQRLAGERALLDVARAALSRGEAARAIEAAERHAQEFPAGQLTEEREAILIRALVQVGNPDEARARAARFHARFPESIFGRTIDAAIASIP
jgi:hypothetical protein